MSEERLFCRCGIEVRIVRLNGERLGLGHTTNPKSAHHYVRLAKPKTDKQRQVEVTR